MPDPPCYIKPYNAQGLPYHCGHKSEENQLLLAFALARICISNRCACIKYLPFRILCTTKLWLPRLLLLLLAAEVPPVLPLVVNRRTRIFSGVALLPVVLPLLPLLPPLLLLLLLMLLLVVLPHTAPLSLLVRSTLLAVLRLSSPARCLV
jgi:hypothetical protein